MTKTEIINDIASSYNLSNRSIATEKITGKGDEDGVTTTCLYDDGDGRNCAAGRYMTPETLEIVKSVHAYNSAPITVIARDCYSESVDDPHNIDHLFRPEVHGHDINFWTDMQMLHDNASNWSYTGLSKAGEAVRNCMLVKYQEQYQEQ